VTAPAVKTLSLRRSLGSGIPLEVVETVGRIERYELRSGKERFRVVIEVDGDRWRIGQAPIAGRWRTIDTRSLAQLVLADIRAEASKCGSWLKAVAPYLRRPDDTYLVTRWLEKFLEREQARCRAHQISPNTLAELERQVASGCFDWWDGRHIFAVTRGTIEDWNAALVEAGRPYRMRQALVETFRRFLGWLHERGEIDGPPPKLRSIVGPRRRKAPRIFRNLDDRRRVLDAIPPEKRGVFLAMSHTLRPQEARAIELVHWSVPDMLVQQACKGRSATAEIRGLKEDDWRVVSADAELEEWIAWRTGEASAEERLRRVGVPLFPNPKGRTGRWSHHALDREWRRALERAFPENTPDVPLYAGTKHTTATDLVRRGVDADTLQRFLGHADRRSTDGYVVLAGDEFKNLVRGRDD
jgi:site-specific recombinase XerD